MRFSRMSTRRSACLPAGVALLVAIGCSRQAPPPSAPPPAEVRAMPVIQRDAPIYQEYVGEVRGIQEVDLRSRVTGILQQVHFADGQYRPSRHAALLNRRPPVPRHAREREGQRGAGRGRGGAGATRRRALQAARPGQRHPETGVHNAVAAAAGARAQLEAQKALITQANLNIEYQPDYRARCRPHRPTPRRSRRSRHRRDDGARHGVAGRSRVRLLQHQRELPARSPAPAEERRPGPPGSRRRGEPGHDDIERRQRLPGDGDDQLRRPRYRSEHRHLHAARDLSQQGPATADRPVRARPRALRDAPQRAHGARAGGHRNARPVFGCRHRRRERRQSRARSRQGRASAASGSSRRD